MEFIVQVVLCVCVLGGGDFNNGPIQPGAPERRWPVRMAHTEQKWSPSRSPLPSEAEGNNGGAAAVGSQRMVLLAILNLDGPTKPMIWKWVSLTLKSIFDYTTFLELKMPSIKYHEIMSQRSNG